MRLAEKMVVVMLAASSCLAAPEGNFFGGVGETPSEIAPYTVIKEAATYEVRVYERMKWVCSHVVDTHPDAKNMVKLFFALFHYTGGENSMGLKLQMTAPVTSLEETYNAEQKLYQICFYIPAAFQENPPTPTDKDVYIQEHPRLTIAARTFSGMVMNISEWEAEDAALLTDLNKAGETDIDLTRRYGMFSLVNERSSRADFFYRAMYDSPLKSTSRRNEVWFILKK
nr:heme-binding protein 2-like [Cherax quadricarinatus]